jgi:DNA (cytosine-5)-methyltransferase 1
MTLETAVKKWATPRVDDAKNKAGPSQLKRHGPALNVQAGGSLNPDWVEWLMQWPIGWTSLEPLDSEMFNVWMHKDDWWMDEPHIPRVATGVPNRVDRLKAIGNGQVPACVCVAWVLLLPKDAMVYRAGKRKRKQEMKE